MTAHPLSRLAAFARPYRRNAVLATVYSVLNKFFDVLPELLIGVAVDVVVNRKQSFLAGLGIEDPMTQLGWQRETVLELLIRLFCAKLTDAVRQGMPRHYLEHEDDLPALRGRLDVTRQFSTLAVSPQKLACRFDALSPDIALNQVMRATVGKLSRLSGAPDNQRALRELSFVYADVTDVPPNALRWDQIVLDRTNRRWRDLLSLARLFLWDRHQQTSAGTSDGHALLFEMNVLFEAYVERILSRALAGSPLINAETRERIGELARSLDYSINAGALTLEANTNRFIAKANQIINQSLTREYLQHESNLALHKFAEKGGTTTVVVPANMQTAPLINIGK